MIKLSKRKPVPRIIYDKDSIFDDGMWYDCKENLINDGNEAPTDDEIWAEIYRTDEDNWEEEYYRLKDFFGNGIYLAVGTVGRWDGNYDCACIFSNFLELLHRFSDCEYIKIWDENGHFFMSGSHHDGTNTVEVKEITKQGKEYSDRWAYLGDKRSAYHVYKKMFSNSRYTHLIHYMHRTYGCPKIQYEKGDWKGHRERR